MRQGAERNDRITDERHDSRVRVHTGYPGTIEPVAVDGEHALERSDVEVSSHHIVSGKYKVGFQLPLHTGIQVDAVAGCGIRIHDLVSLLDHLDAADGQV